MKKRNLPSTTVTSNDQRCGWQKYTRHSSLRSRCKSVLYGRNICRLEPDLVLRDTWKLHFIDDGKHSVRHLWLITQQREPYQQLKVLIVKPGVSLECSLIGSLHVTLFKLLGPKWADIKAHSFVVRINSLPGLLFLPTVYLNSSTMSLSHPASTRLSFHLAQHSPLCDHHGVELLGAREINASTRFFNILLHI